VIRIIKKQIGIWIGTVAVEYHLVECNIRIIKYEIKNISQDKLLLCYTCMCPHFCKVHACHIVKYIIKIGYYNNVLKCRTLSQH